MGYLILGLLLGILVGIYAPFTIPSIFARYTAVGIMGILDSIFGAIRADLQGKYNPSIFISGLFFNMVLAMIFTWLGDRLSIDLYLAVIVVFTIRIFTNIGIIRYPILTRFLGRKRVQEEIEKK